MLITVFCMVFDRKVIESLTPRTGGYAHEAATFDSTAKTLIQ